MKQTILRNLRCQWRPLAGALAGAAALTGFLCLCCVFCAPIDAIGETVAVSFAPFAAGSWILIGFGLSLSFYTQSAFLYLLLGTTRKGIFVVRQLADLCFCLAGALATAIGVAVTGLWGTELSGAPFAFFCGLFLICQMTELCGLLAYRFGKWGMIFYAIGIFVFCVFGGIFVGALAGDERVEMLRQMMRWAIHLPLVTAGGLMLVAGALLAAASWLIFRRAQVKV